MTPLEWDVVWACEAADVQRLTQLLEQKAEVNYRSTHGFSPLHRLIRSKAPPDKVMQCLKLLLAAKADPSTTEYEHGETPLISLCKRQSNALTAEMADLLLMAAPRTIDLLDHNGGSALAYVCTRVRRFWSQYESRVVKVLLSHKADPNVGRFMPLIMAARAKNWHVTAMLLRGGANPKHPDMHNKTAMPEILSTKWTQTIKFAKKKCP